MHRLASDNIVTEATSTRAATSSPRIPPPPPPLGWRAPAEQNSNTNVPRDEPTGDKSAELQLARKPQILPAGDLRFHPYQQPKRGQEFLGSRVCICDNCGWRAGYNTQILPWQGAFVHKHSLYAFFRRKHKGYSCAALEQHWKDGLIDATWYCMWCLVETDAAGRTQDQICRAYNLYSEPARRRAMKHRPQDSSRTGPLYRERWSSFFRLRARCGRIQIIA